MNDELYALLSPCAPTWHMLMDGHPKVGIVYQLYLGQDAGHQSGAPTRESGSYRVTVYQREFDQALIDRVLKALREKGWAIGARRGLYDSENKYYMFAVNATKWREHNAD